MPGVFELLKKGWDVYAKHFRTYRVYLVLLFIGTIAANFLKNTYGPTEGTLVAQNWNEVASFGIITFPIFLAVFYLGLVLVLAVYRNLKGQTTGPKENFKDALRRLFPTLGAYILPSIPLAVGGMIIFFQFLKYGLVPPASSLLVSGLTLLILVIPGLVLVTWFMFSYIEALINGKPVIAAQKESYALVHGHFWHVLWLVIATGILISMVGYLLTDISTWIIVKMVITSATTSARVAAWGEAIITTLVATLIAPWGYGITLNMYSSLKELRVQK